MDRWFEGSKVVDKNGNPLICFHGSAIDIKYFDTSHFGNNTGLNQEAFFFTTNEDAAKAYSAHAQEIEDNRNFKAYLNPCYLYIEKPFIYDAKGKELGGEGIYTLVYAIQDKDPKLADQEEFLPDFYDEIKELSDDEAYDGIIIKNVKDSPNYSIFNGLQDNYIVFSPKQIRRVNLNEFKETVKTDNFNQAFWKWFGKSKVVDKQGIPLIVYHGTDNDFKVFKLTKHSHDAGYYGAGFYFASTPGEASYYGKIIMPCYLKIENPFTIKDNSTSAEDKVIIETTALIDLGFLQDKDIINSVELWKKYRYLLDYVECKKDGNEWVAVFTNIDSLNLSKSDYEWLKYERPIGCGYSKENAIYNIWLQIKEHFKIKLNFSLTDYIRNNSYEFTEFLEKKGYDGVIIGDEYIVFEPNQIKAIDNKGTWSSTSDNIYECLNEDYKGYRYILTFEGEPQGIGMFQGLSEIDQDEEYIESLEDLFKELEIPEEVFIKNRFTTSYFTEKGLEKFKSAIDTLQQAYRDYSGFDIELITEDIPEDKIVYQDEYQIIIKGIKEGKNIYETLNIKLKQFI